MPEYLAQFPSAYESVGKARRAIVAFARHWFCDEKLADIESAVGEGLANCAEHGHRNGTFIEVRCECDGTTLSIRIRDAGCGFERWDAAATAAPLPTAARGFGTFIMRQLMDEFEYSEHGRQLRLAMRVEAADLVTPDEHAAGWS